VSSIKVSSYDYSFLKFAHNTIDIFNENSSGMTAYVCCYDLADYGLMFFVSRSLRMELRIGGI
jgi:hypothetical protein